MTRCHVCLKLQLRPCRRNVWCIRWAQAAEKREALSFQPQFTNYSKAVGKFIVSPWGDSP